MSHYHKGWYEPKGFGYIMAKGSSATIQSSEEQNAIRRASKARRRSQRSDMRLPTSNIFDDIRKDRELAARKSRKGEARRQHNYKEQATIAFADPVYQSLECGSLAEKVAAGIMLKFISVVPATNQSRTHCAFEKVKKVLSPDELKREGAIKKGRAVARDALRAAYRQVGQQQEQQLLA